MIQIPDATTNPQEYRDALLELVVGRDPLEILENTIDEVQQLLQKNDDTMWLKAQAGEWSARHTLGHLFDVEIVYGFRWRLVLTAEQPLYPGYDEKLWAELPKPDHRELFAAWQPLRQANLLMLRSVDREMWRRTGRHGEQGEEDLEVMIRKLAGHDLAHLDQIRRALAG